MPEELCQVSPKLHYVSLALHSDPSPWRAEYFILDSFFNCRYDVRDKEYSELLVKVEDFVVKFRLWTNQWFFSLGYVPNDESSCFSFGLCSNHELFSLGCAPTDDCSCASDVSRIGQRQVHHGLLLAWRNKMFMFSEARKTLCSWIFMNMTQTCPETCQVSVQRGLLE